MRPRWERLLAVAIFIVAAYLAMRNLGDAYFWDDEAQTALIGRNYLQQGEYTGWDGRNLYTYRNGILLKPDLSFGYVPSRLQFAVVAASFKVFGPSTWAGRFPFVLAGLAALALLWRVLQREFPEAPVLRLYAFSLVALSVVFLLNIRQCRYYAASFLFALATYWAHRRAMDKDRWVDHLAGVAFAVLLFYSNYLLGFAFLAAVAVRGTRRAHWDEMRRSWRKLAVCVGLLGIATVPYAVMHRIWRVPVPLPHEPWYERRPLLVWWNLRELSGTNMLPWMLVVALVFFLWRSDRRRDPARTAVDWLLIAVANAVVIALFSPQPTTGTSIADVRYLTLSLPFAAGALAFALAELHRKSAVLALGVFAVSVATNVFTLAPGQASARSLLPAYMAEVHQHTQTPDEVVSRYLIANARKDDLVFATPDHFTYPLQFYAGHKVRFCCALTPDAPIDWSRVDAVRTPARWERDFPEWIVGFGASPMLGAAIAHFSRAVEGTGGRTTRRYSLQAVLEVFAMETQRPELPWHSFGTVRTFDRDRQAVYVFRRSDH